MTREHQESADEAAACAQIEHNQERDGYKPEPIEPLPPDYFETQPF